MPCAWATSSASGTTSWWSTEPFKTISTATATATATAKAKAKAGELERRGAVRLSAPWGDAEETRSVIREIHGAEIFVTLTGQKTEMALGWLTDDLLKGT